MFKSHGYWVMVGGDPERGTTAYAAKSAKPK